MNKVRVLIRKDKPAIKSVISETGRASIWLYAAALTAAEIITAYSSPIYGIICHVVLLLVLLVHASMSYKQDIYTLYAALSLAPLVRISSLSMPLVSVPPIYWYLIISLPLFTAAFYVMRLAGYKRREVGLAAGSLPLQFLVAFLGVPLGLIEYLILKPQPLVSELTLQYAWFPALILLFSTGFMEEFIFRGIMLRAASATMGWWYGVFYISLIFAALHITHRSPADLIFVFAAALLFSIAVGFFRSILGVSLAHGITNIGLYIVWPFILK